MDLSPSCACPSTCNRCWPSDGWSTKIQCDNSDAPRVQSRRDGSVPHRLTLFSPAIHPSVHRFRLPNLYPLEGNIQRVMSSVDSGTNFSEKQRAKINELRASLGSLPDKLCHYASDASIARYLTARNWNVQKATKMLKETLKWRLEYEPDKIRWDEIACEAETGKIYRTSFSDNLGRSILVMRPRCENSKSIKGKIRYLVYCMENAILNLPADQEQMVWLIDFKGFDLSNLSIRTTKETADVLQNHYPERLGLAILYNPPKFFEPFWNIAKHLLEPKTYRKVKFVYPDDGKSKMIMEEFFNMDELDSAFGGNNQVGFNINDYAARMREDEQRMPFFWCQENGSSPEKSATLDDNFSAGNCESEPELDPRGPTENYIVGSSSARGTSLP